MNDNNIALVITEDRLKAFITIRYSENIDALVVKQLINEKNVNYGIHNDAVKQIIDTPQPGSYVIAEGDPPVEGRDGYVEYFFNFTVSKEQQDIKDNQNVDFREIFNVPSVNAETLLAVYHPMVQGKDGTSVTGSPIPARKVFDLVFRAGKGATLSRDGMSVVSTVSGRPWVKKMGRNVTVGVEAVYTHEGDVDIKSGNLRFNGDVIINGNVNDNMIIDVTGNLKIWGFVSRSTINAGGKLEVMKVITASKVNVGGISAFLNEVNKKLIGIQETIINLEKAARQFLTTLQRNNKTAQYGQIVMALIDKKFMHLRTQLDDLFKLIKKKNNKETLPDELKDCIEQLIGLAGIKVLGLTSLDPIKEGLVAALKFLDAADNNSSDIIANSVWNSEVAATGDIKLLGQGMFNSRLISMRSVELVGVARGGEIIARGNVVIGEIGAQMGVRTFVKTEPGSIIKANLLYSGSVLQIGKKIFTAKEDRSMIVARIDSNGEISL